MTATFGKLENAVLTFRPGLNIIEAPNEWGKSTWCAFLAAMLYGLDTRAKTTKTTLADKERYAPWSGAPMEGRIDIHWNGRDITIERKTKGRIPLGDFRAYETHSGVTVPELTAADCGQILLGVEQTVFRRAGFIRLKDMPVTQDESLRSRLNALVTTGDESGDGERLAKGLRDLKNRIRYNRSGLLPKAEAERDALKERLRELDALTAQLDNTEKNLAEQESRIEKLENHRTALAYAAAERNARRAALARKAREEARRQLEESEAVCAGLPGREEAEEKLRQLGTLREQWSQLQEDFTLLIQPDQSGENDPVFSGLTGEEAEAQARADGLRYQAMSGVRPLLPFLIPGALLLIAAGVLLVLAEHVLGGIGLGLALLLLCIGFIRGAVLRKQAEKIAQKYGNSDPRQWLASARRHDAQLQIRNRETLAYDMALEGLERRKTVLQMQRRALCGEKSVDDAAQWWNRSLASWDARDAALREFRRAEEHVQTLSSLLRPTPAPGMADDLTCSEEETLRLIAQAHSEQQRLLSRKGQYQGRMEALGRRDALEKQLRDVKKRIQKLEDTYAALTISQETLAQARLELQRRFAPRISRRAQELMGRLTNGRYDRLSLDGDFSLRAGAGEETTLHEALWRSEGTVDQLYLALRLAVAEALTPEAPLVLDDALVRFDDARLKAAMEILSEMSEEKQVILFTCQSRERNV